MAIGECRNRVVDFANSIGIEVYSNEKLSDAFKMGWLLSERDDVLLLSPASASWDQYKQCEDRGSEFKKNVNEL